MTYEVELKFAIATSDIAILRTTLLELRAVPDHAIEQCDRYFNHPARDFAQSNEALRVRSIGDRCLVTYKGPVLDRTVKTRREIELPIGVTAEEGDQFAEMLTLLGFRPVRSVRKTRVPFHLSWESVPMEVVIDSVPELGVFLEIETIADDASRDARQTSILSLAARLGMGAPERRSYLTMLLQKDRTDAANAADAASPHSSVEGMS